MAGYVKRERKDEGKKTKEGEGRAGRSGMREVSGGGLIHLETL